MNTPPQHLPPYYHVCLTCEAKFFSPARRVTCPRCGTHQWGVLETGEFALRCKCGQFNTKGRMSEEITGRCWMCAETLDDHDWSSDVAICIKGRKAKR